MNLVPIWASPSPGDFIPHLYLIAVDSFLASPGTGDSDPIVRLPDLETLVLTWASLIPGNSVPHLSLTWTCLLWIHSEPHPDMVTLVPVWMSPRPGESGTPQGLKYTW